MPFEMAPVVGIDLGTSESRIAVWKNGQVQVILDHSTKETFIPSYVSFTDTEILVGEPARNQLGRNRKNTVFDVKRLIGRAQDGTLRPTKMFYWPYRVTHTLGKAQISVENDEKKQQYFPERIMSWMLLKMMGNAERFLGLQVTQAVMTVPTYFNDSQRNQATTGVANMAYVNLIQVIDNSTAAAIAYCHKNNLNDAGLVLVYDLGTYTFEVSVLNVYDFNPKMVWSDTYDMLGGKIIDQLMVSQCLKAILRDYNIDFQNDAKAMSKIFTACEEAKKTLSFKNAASLKIHNLWRGHDFITEVTREHFEALCTSTIAMTLIVVEQALCEVRIQKSQIDHVVLVGGSTRIPKLREMVKDFFDLEELDQNIDPEEIVAYGAAVQGALLTNSLRLDRTETNEVQKGRRNQYETMPCNGLLHNGVHDRTQREWTEEEGSSDEDDAKGQNGSSGTYFAKPAYVISEEDDSIISSDTSGMSPVCVDDKPEQIFCSKDKETLTNQLNTKGDFTSDGDDLLAFPQNNEEDMNNNTYIESELSTIYENEYLPLDDSKNQAEMLGDIQDGTILCDTTLPEIHNSKCSTEEEPRWISQDVTKDQHVENVVQAEKVQESDLHNYNRIAINTIQNSIPDIQIDDAGSELDFYTADECNEQESSGDFGNPMVSQVIPSNDVMSSDPCRFQFHNNYCAPYTSKPEYYIDHPDPLCSYEPESNIPGESSRSNSLNETGTSLNLLYQGGVLEISKKKLTIPCTTYEIWEDSHVCINIPIQEGTAKRGENCYVDSVPKAELTVVVDADGLVNVNGEKVNLIFTPEEIEGRNSSLAEMRNELQNFRNMEAAWKERDIAKSNLENFVYEVKQNVEEVSEVSEEEKQWVKNECLEVLDFIEDNEYTDKIEFEKKLLIFQKTFSGLINRLNNI